MDPPPELRRSLSLWQVTVSGVGIVIGAGIYVLIGSAAAEAGNGVWLSFLIAAALSALTGTSYAELAGMFPSAGAEFTFAGRAFGNFTGFVVGWLMIAANLIAAAAVSIGFARYLRYFVDVDSRMAAIALLAGVTAVIAFGIQRSIWLSAVLVLVQIGGLLLVIAAGAPHFGGTSLIAGATAGGVLSGAALIFFAFIGFDEVVTLSEETRNPSATIPRALLISLGICSLLYALVALAAVSVVGASALAASDTPLALVLAHNWGARSGDIIAYVALASTANTTLLVMTAASRLTFRMATDATLPRTLSVVGRRTAAPWVAALAGCAIAACFALISDIALVASVTDFAVFAIFAVVNAAVIRLRFSHPDASRTFVSPGAFLGVPIVPLLGLLSVPVVAYHLDPNAWLIGGACIAAGAVFWLIRRALGQTPTGVRPQPQIGPRQPPTTP